jgi:uncharacterized protein (TIGR03437 family)
VNEEAILDRLKQTVFAALAIGMLGATAASAQTAANVTVVSGNGQIICSTCTTSIFRFFLPLVVRVTDANGQPIGNKTVNWNLISSQGPLPFFLTSSTTDGNGIATTFLSQTSQGGSLGQPYLQTTITATADSAATTFTETQGLSDVTNHALQYILARLDAPPLGTTLEGIAGAPGATPVKVHVDAFGTPIPNASVRLFRDPIDLGALPTDDLPTRVSLLASQPSALCATGPGADPGSVLTDAKGDAVCTPVFGNIAGIANVRVLVGGVDPYAADPIARDLVGTPTVIGYSQVGGFVPISVKAGVAGAIQISSGNAQTVNPGLAASPLIVKVTDVSGLNTISGATVVWTVSPAGVATVSPTTSTSNAQGLASTVPTLSAGAAGTITVRAGLTGGLSNIATTFTINVNVLITGLQKISGEPQTTPANTGFGQPLVVQVNGSTGQPIANYPVSFTISGPGSLSASTANTNSSGRAQVTVQAGATSGTVTVTAQVGGFSQTFTLTVIPPGPSLTAGSFFNTAGLQRGSLSPCSLATIIASGLAPAVQGTVLPSNAFGPWPTSFVNNSVTYKVSVNNIPAPISSVANVNGQEQIAFQVPCDVTPGSSVPINVNIGGGSATVNVAIQAASPGLFETVMSDGVRRAVAIRPDGTFVSLENPARRGEVIRVYATGMGPTLPAITTGSLGFPGIDSLVLGEVIVGLQNSGVRVISSRAASNLIGLFEVSFQVPANAPVGNDLVLSVAVNPPDRSGTQFSNGTKLPVQ